jgi:hypothetical protein
MYLNDDDTLKIETTDLHGLDDKCFKIVSRLEGKVFLRKKPKEKLKKSIISKEGGWQFDEDGKKYHAGPESVEVFEVNSCDEEFYNFSFWFNMFTTLKNPDLYYTRLKPWIENG